ncbi:serine hydrolase domain-containing protein [Cohnella hongkongensis]|uniref:Serine hydrolase domain-containing protein n=1 Tax=Cohnella hongkongensis TaxID=178337 RepID=A0ABV9FAK8_9BACL
MSSLGERLSRTGSSDLELLAALRSLNLRSCLIERDGDIRLEHYRDPLAAEETAKVNSCTKSFLSALIAIAMDKRLLPGPETPLAEFFPQLLTDPDPRKRDIELGHLLTMTAGFRWTEFGGIQSFPRMTRTENWVDFVLSQPMSEAPGRTMEYNSGASQLLSALLVQAAGMPVARFADLELFGPLGIERYEWDTDPQGIHTGGFGLRLRPADLLKLGQLYLNRGRWGNAQLVSEERAIRSVQPAVPASAPNRGYYGWHWWTDVLSRRPEETGSPLPFSYFYARGYGGQFVYVVPAWNVVVVLTDDRRKKERNPTDAFRELIAPALLLSDL